VGPSGSTGELVLVPVATSVPSVAVLYRAEHVAMVRRLVLMGAPTERAEGIAHRAFARVAREWDALGDPLTSVRRIALEDLLARFRPAARAPTTSPDRDGAPHEWDAVRPILDPLTPEDRAAMVLRGYDGLDDESVDQLVPVRRRRGPPPPTPPVDLALAELLTAAVADVTPPSRLTDLFAGRDGPDLEGPGPPPTSHRRRAWVGAAVAALVVAGVFGRGFDADLGTPAGPDQELRVGPAGGGVVLTANADSELSSCAAADPLVGPGGTLVPEEGDTDPWRVARVLATDRRALITLHRGARDARMVDRDGVVRRSARPGVGRIRHIYPGDDRQIQIVIGSTDDCPQSPQVWKGVPLVFTSLADAKTQPEIVVAGAFADGTAWEVRDRPGHGLCATVGTTDAPCGTELADLEALAPVRLVADPAGRRMVFGYLPPGATTARLEHPGGQLDPPPLLRPEWTVFALPSAPADRPERVRFFDQGGAAVAAVPYPGA
jgi:hypothetical protein